MRGLSVEQLVFIIALVLWPVFALIRRARAQSAVAVEPAPIAEDSIVRVERPAPPRPVARRVPTVEVSRKRWDRAQLRATIVAMTVLGRPRGLD